MAGPGGDPDSGDERRPDARPAPQMIVPDDASELELDARALRRERAAAARRARFERLLKTRRWRRYGLSGPLVAGILVLVALFGAALALLVPGGGRERAIRRPLDTTAPSPRGTVGGLLADRPLVVTGAQRSARDLRPAVLALVPVPCRCERLVDELSGQAAEFGLRLVLVGGDHAEAELRRLLGSARHGPAQLAYDLEDRLAYDYAARGPTLVLVRDDGRVIAVEREAQAGVRRESVLRTLVSSAAGG